MQINLSEVFHSEGKTEEWREHLDIKAYRGADGNYEIVSGEPVNIRVTNLGGRKLSLSGSAAVTLRIPCARCLTPVDYPCDLEFDEELDMAKTAKERIDDLEEQPYLDGYLLDVDRLVCTELALSLPIRVLCREDCKGICSRCGANLNLGPCGCDQSSPDPRMAAIRDLFSEFNGEGRS